MPSIYDLKPKFQNLLRPLMRALARAGITPNLITMAAIGGSLAVGISLMQARKQHWLLLLLPIWLFARMALNALDGMMARELNQASALGAVLNELGDVLSDLGLYLPLALLAEQALWPVVLFNLGAALTEFCGVLSRALGASRRYDGPLGKSDRAFLVGALALLTFCLPQFWAWWPAVFWVATALTVLTCFNRLRHALRETR
jgi:CDP-diacylglycerol---glycerol-3-phosphate 3-phosphatidyltransferase